MYINFSGKYKSKFLKREMIFSIYLLKNEQNLPSINFSPVNVKVFFYPYFFIPV